MLDQSDDKPLSERGDGIRNMPRGTRNGAFGLATMTYPRLSFHRLGLLMNFDCTMLKDGTRRRRS
jgi:hypothetical protein